MKRRALAIILAAAMAMGATACGSSKTAETTKAAEKATEAAAEAKTEAASETTAAEAADDYGFPTDETITWVVPGKAGGGSDLAIRYMSEAMTKDLGLTNTVTNYDSNTVGHQTVANAKPDGATIMLATAALNIQWITGNADVNPKEDLTLIAAMDDNGFSALCAPADAPYNTFAEMVEYAKANPGKLNAGMPNSGNNTMQFGRIQKTADVQFNAVEASSESDRLTALAGGFIDLGFAGIGNAKEYEAAGKLKVIATIAGDGLKIADYDASLPDNYKTIQEQGYDDLYWNVKHYVYGPAGMDQAQVEKMNAALEKIYNDKDCHDGLVSVGHIPEWHNLEESVKIRDAEYQAEIEVSDYLGIKVND